MSSNTSTWQAKYESWKAKGDEFLVEVLHKGEGDDRAVAMFILKENYEDKINGYIASRLWGLDNRHDWVDDVSQETWKAFDIAIRLEGKRVEKGVPNLLFGIAKNKALTAFQGIANDWRFEHRIPPTAVGGRDPEEEMLADITSKERRMALLQLPFSAGIGDCPRIVWTLRHVYKFSIPVIARLMDKSRNEVDVHYSTAYEKITQYCHSKEYRLATALQEQPWSHEYTSALQTACHLVEIPAEPMYIQFTDEELEPLNMKVEEFRQGHTMTLIMPGPASEMSFADGYLLALLDLIPGYGIVRPSAIKTLLTRPRNKREKETLEDVYNTYRNPRLVVEYVPRQLLLVLRVDEHYIRIVDQIQLTLRPWPDPNPELFPFDAIYFSKHPQRVNKYLGAALFSDRTYDVLDKLDGQYEAPSHYSEMEFADGPRVPIEINKACMDEIELRALKLAYIRSVESVAEDIHKHEDDIEYWRSLLEKIRMNRKTPGPPLPKIGKGHEHTGT